jgi:hypothetical protein
MSWGPQLLLVAAVAAVGVLHTLVPDHWMPIALLARQRRWSHGETVTAALRAGAGHVGSTLAIGLAVWVAGAEAGLRFGHLVDTLSSLALFGFGGWIAISALHEQLRPAGQGHGHAPGHSHAGGHHDHVRPAHGHHDRGHDGLETAPADDALYAPAGGGAAVLVRHIHPHRHDRGWVHAHWHDHGAATAHAAGGDVPPLHRHRHKTTGRTALLLVLGSSPMVEGIPVFFAAARYGAVQLGVMAAVFAASTIATYVLLCASAAFGLGRLRLGAVERYGEVMSGAFIALVGIAFWAWPPA